MTSTSTTTAPQAPHPVAPQRKPTAVDPSTAPASAPASTSPAALNTDETSPARSEATALEALQAKVAAQEVEIAELKALVEPMQCKMAQLLFCLKLAGKLYKTPGTGPSAPTPPTPSVHAPAATPAAARAPAPAPAEPAPVTKGSTNPKKQKGKKKALKKPPGVPATPPTAMEAQTKAVVPGDMPTTAAPPAHTSTTTLPKKRNIFETSTRGAGAAPSPSTATATPTDPLAASPSSFTFGTASSPGFKFKTSPRRPGGPGSASTSPKKAGGPVLTPEELAQMSQALQKLSATDLPTVASFAPMDKGKVHEADESPKAAATGAGEAAGGSK